MLHPVRINSGRLAEFVFGYDGNEPVDVVRAAFVHASLGPRHERVGKWSVIQLQSTYLYDIVSPIALDG